jgi:putative membrane protein
MVDLLLAVVHHLLAFGMAAAITAQLVLVRPGMRPPAVQLAAKYDIALGLMAMSLLAIGFLRVFFGAKGADFYLHNHVFWTKVVLYGVVGLLSIKPTRAFLRWRKAQAADAGFAPEEVDIRAVRKTLMIEIHIFALLPIAAAAMARGYGYVPG